MKYHNSETEDSIEECDPLADKHPCGKEFCPEDPEKCIHFRGGLR